MPSNCENRLTIVGRAKDVESFNRAVRWQRRLGARHVELLECTATRNVWAFETDTPPLKPLRGMSVLWPAITLLLEYDQRGERVKGLAKTKHHKMWHYKVTY